MFVILGVNDRLNGLPEQTLGEVPIIRVGIGLKMTCTVSVASSHGPSGSFVVKTKFTDPLSKSWGLGI